MVLLYRYHLLLIYTPKQHQDQDQDQLEARSNIENNSRSAQVNLISSKEYLRNKFSITLASYSHDINSGLTKLYGLGNKFQEYNDKALRYRLAEDLLNDAHFTELAREERLDLQKHLHTLNHNITYRSGLCGQKYLNESFLHN